MDAPVVRRPRPDWLPRSIVSGFIASTVMLFGFIAAFLVGRFLATVPITERPGGAALRDWFFYLTNNPVSDLAANNLYAGIGLFLAGGLAWAVLYAAWCEPRLPDPPWVGGAVYALLPWLISQFVVMPLVGGGLAGATLGAGPLPAFGALLLHLAYGATLGAVYGPLGDLDAETLRPPEPAPPTIVASLAGSRTATGILAGALVGVLAAILAVRLGLAGGDAHPAALILGGALLLSALGGLVGSFADLTPAGGRRPSR